MGFQRATWAAVSFFALVACTAGSSGGPSTIKSLEHSGDLGKSCLRSSDCASGHCVSRTNGTEITEREPGICTEPCADTSSCLAGWTCLASSSGADLCRCFGSGGAEVCDGKDNDCDGKIDEEENGEGCCQAPHIACATVCVDPKTDRQNCGGCGQSCAGACVDGTCVCAAATPTLCPTACADLMTDPKNCGACGVVCGAGTQCSAGTCRCGFGGGGEACAVGAPVAGSANVCGEDERCHTQRTYSPPLGRQFHAAAVGDGEIFVGATQGNTIISSNVLRFDVATGASSTLYPDASGVGLAANGHDLAFSSNGLIGCPNASCNSTPLATVTPPLAVFGGAAFWLESKTVARCALTGCGGTPEVFGTDAGLGAISGLRVDASGAFFLESDTIRRVATPGATVETVGVVTGAKSLVLDVDTVYVITNSGISACAKTGCSGGATSVLARPGITSLFVDGTTLHWVDGGGISTCLKPACSSQKQVLADTAAFGMDAQRYYFRTDKAAYSVTK